MELNEKIDLIKKNTVEIITENELKLLLEEKTNPVTYCGYEPSGGVHFGHVVTLTKLKDLEQAGFKVKILLADWHAWLNKKGTWEEIHDIAAKWKEIIKKIGIKNPKIVLGTSFQRSKEYIDDVFTLSLNTTISRALRSMQEVARDIDNATVSQTIYPLMQIVDMKYLDVDVAEAGIEQRKIHMLSREIMNKINYRKPIFVHTPLVNSLLGPGKKMSSSIPESMLSVNNNENEIKKKISKAYCPEGEIENNPILEICKLVILPNIKKFEINRKSEFGGDLTIENYKDLEEKFKIKEIHPADLKSTTTKYLTEIFSPLREILE